MNISTSGHVYFCSTGGVYKDEKRPGKTKTKKKTFIVFHRSKGFIIIIYYEREPIPVMNIYFYGLNEYLTDLFSCRRWSSLPNIAILTVTSPIVINAPTRGLLTVETKDSFVLLLAKFKYQKTCL